MRILRSVALIHRWLDRSVIAEIHFISLAVVERDHPHILQVFAFLPTFRAVHD